MEDLNNKIKNEINKVSSKINDISLKDSKFEETKYFSKKHIIGHVGAAGAHLGIEIPIAIFSTLTIPVCGIILAASTLVIHGSILLFKVIRDKIYKIDDLLENITKYRNIFIDNLNVYENEIANAYETAIKNLIREIKDKNLAKTLNFTEEETQKFEEIYNLFEKKLEENFNLE